MPRFDQAIIVASNTVRPQLARHDAEITIVRDPRGRLTVVLPRDAMPLGAWTGLAAELHSLLGAYSPGENTVLIPEEDLIDRRDVMNSPDRSPQTGLDRVWLVDRLLTNQDWLRLPPASSSAIPPTATAFSLKGGAGRTTAVALWAWHLARAGQRVLAVDLDLEAPGLASVLLDDDELPDYGLADWLVEALVNEADETLLQDCLLRSPLAMDSTGVIEVLPAFGKKTVDYVAKIGRLYLPIMSADAEVGLSERLRSLLQACARRPNAPTAILLDARAGLHDIGAAAVTQLNAEVFLFARDDPQSWQALRLLFEHLSRSPAIKWGMPDDDLRWRLKMVGAQMVKTEGALSSSIDSSYRTWASLYDDEAEATSQSGPAQTFAMDDPEAPHYPLPVFFDPTIQGRSLVDASTRPPWEVVEGAFSRFLQDATSRLFPDQSPGLPAPSPERP